MDRKESFRAALCCFLAACASALAAEACPDAELVSPPRGSIQTDPRPPIVWKALPGVTQYRVQVESRVPNGRVISRLDNQVAGTQFLTTSALADQQAVVKVRVTGACPEAAQGTVSEMGPSFFVDVRALCPAPIDLKVRSDAPARIEWGFAPGRVTTEISVFSASHGGLLLKEDLTGSQRNLPALSEAVVIALRNRCKEAVSETLYRVVAAPAR
jgi:hypothetical protein